jgi:hypothetical protein
MSKFWKPNDWPVTEVWIETGTYHGESDIVALDYGYPIIKSVEINPSFVAVASKNINLYRNKIGSKSVVELQQGSSPDVLRRIINRDKSTTFWLDAHWSHYGSPGSLDETYGECPLIEELKSILSQPWRVPFYVAIDDSFHFNPINWSGDAVDRDGKSVAEYFDPSRWIQEQWPMIDDILKLLPNRKWIDTGEKLLFWPVGSV